MRDAGVEGDSNGLANTARLKEFERREQEWQRTEALLRSAVSRFSLLSPVDDLVFVSKLATLRSSIEDGLPTLTLEPLLEAIGGYIQKLEGAGRVASLDPNRSSLSGRLLEMIGEVQYPSAFLESLEPVKALLRHDISENTNNNFVRSLEAYFEMLADFYQHVNDEKIKMNEYLHQLTNQLMELNDNLKITESLQHASLIAGADIDRQVNSEVTEMEGSISTEININNLKTGIQKRLQTIRNCIADYIAKENYRHEQSEQLISKLNYRIHKMEMKTEHLQLLVAEKQKQNLSDALTGIGNRQAYDERIKQECERYYRNNTPVTLIVCDVDNFKVINDKYGHAAGDKVLMNLSKVLQKNIRSTDFVARFGGEEFVIILPGIAIDEGARAAEKLRKKIEACRFRAKHRALKVTISGGVAQLKKDDSPVSLFERADNALYVAKEGGRNRVELE